MLTYGPFTQSTFLHLKTLDADKIDAFLQITAFTLGAGHAVTSRSPKRSNNIARSSGRVSF